MKRYPIVVVKSKRLYETLPYKILISRKAYLAILAWGRKQHLWDDIYPTIELTCARCGSFVIEFFQLYDIIELLLDDEVYVELQSDPVFRDIVARVMRALEENLSEAWDAVYGEGAKEPSDKDEVAVILNPDCSCYSVFVGEDPEEQVTDEPDYSRDPNVSVVKWIGPRQQKQYIPSFNGDEKKDAPTAENVDRKDTTMDSEEGKEEATKAKLPVIVAGVKAMLQSLRTDLDDRFEEEKESRSKEVR